MIVRRRPTSSIRSRRAGERRILTFLVWLRRITNLVDPSLMISRPTDFETGRTAVSSSRPLHRRVPEHLSGIRATPLGATVTARPLISTRDRRGLRGFVGGELTVTETFAEPLRPAELVTVSVAECTPGFANEWVTTALLAGPPSSKAQL